MTIYRVTLCDRETQTVVGYYKGAWTTDQHRTLTLRRREAAEDHAARMRDRCPRDAELITVEEFPAGPDGGFASGPWQTCGTRPTSDPKSRLRQFEALRDR